MELSSLLNKIDSLKKEADSLKPVKPEFEKVFWDKYRLEFNYNSNHLEGNTLTYGHTQLLLLFDKVGGDYSLRELEEMKAHDVALKMVIEEAVTKEHEISEKFMKEINEIILVRPFYKEAITSDGQPTRRLIEPGQYKKFPNSVRLENGEIFNYASPEETPALMGDLIDWYKKEIEKKELHPIQVASLFHYRFVRIHPFDDSNGRTARLMMNYILIRNGYSPVVIESDDKKNYLTALNRADTGDIESFVDYIINQSLRWQELYLKAMKGETIEEPNDFDKEVDLLKKNLSKIKGPKIGISEETIKNLLTDSFVPLIKEVERKMKKFDDLFLNWNIYINTTTGFAENFNTTGSIENHFQSLINHLKNGGTLRIDFTHVGFTKASTNVFNVYLNLTIRFDSYVYEIQINRESLRKLYDENLTQSEIEEIAQKMARLEFEEIKKQTQ